MTQDNIKNEITKHYCQDQQQQQKTQRKNSIFSNFQKSSIFKKVQKDIDVN